MRLITKYIIYRMLTDEPIQQMRVCPRIKTKIIPTKYVKVMNNLWIGGKPEMFEDEPLIKNQIYNPEMIYDTHMLLNKQNYCVTDVKTNLTQGLNYPDNEMELFMQYELNDEPISTKFINKEVIQQITKIHDHNKNIMIYSDDLCYKSSLVISAYINKYHINPTNSGCIEKHFFDKFIALPNNLSEEQKIINIATIIRLEAIE